MEEIGIKLQKAVLIMMSLVLMLGVSGCEDRLDSPRPSTGEGKAVEVSLCVEFADEVNPLKITDGTLDTKGLTDNKACGLNVRFGPSLTSKAVSDVVDPLATAKPDQLYGLEVWQYDGNGTFQSGMGKSIGDVAIGSSFTVTLKEMEKCQLLIIARGSNGSTNTVSSLANKSLSAIREMALSRTSIDSIKDINTMPFIMLLTDAKIVNENGTYKIQSKQGTDVRILLKRLAARFHLTWDYEVPDYALSQVILDAIPADYRLIPTLDENGRYPSEFDQYTYLLLSPEEMAKKGYACWLPANVRGSVGGVTSQNYRSRENAPTASTYLQFTATHSDGSKKLNYRVYMGKAISDFSVTSNTNYIYNVGIKHTGILPDDKRVTFVDPISASQNNNNLVPTANCFMVPPGGAFCFDPYTFWCDGSQIDNVYLTGGTGAWCNRDISEVKLIWQTRDEGNIGEPAMGIVNSDDDHSNIVEWKDNKIYCRVAPKTKGGSGGIAAYDSGGKIVWSWHVWVTDYAPSSIGGETVLIKNQRKFALSYNGTKQLPMMDRNLGAYDGYTEIPGSILLMSRANGFHYNTGRKDPFPSSYTRRNLSAEYKFSVTSDRPAKDVLVRFKADAKNWIIPSNLSGNSIETGYRQPLSPGRLANASVGWAVPKTLHDPCPAGWRIPTENELQALINLNTNYPSDANIKNEGGVLLKFDDTDIKTYLRLSGYVIGVAQLNNVGYCGYILTSTKSGSYSKVLTIGLQGAVAGDAGARRFTGKEFGDIHSTRCIQERVN